MGLFGIISIERNNTTFFSSSELAKWVSLASLALKERTQRFFVLQNWWNGSLRRHRLLWLWGKWYELPWSGASLNIQHVKIKIIIIVIAMCYGLNWSSQNTNNQPESISVWLLKRWRGWVLQSAQATSPSPTSVLTTLTRLRVDQTKIMRKIKTQP